jgi:hypothetical protein
MKIVTNQKIKEIFKMEKMLRYLLLLISLILSGCATDTSALRTQTAGVLGYSPDEIKITNLRSDNTADFYMVKTPNGDYACTSQGGLQRAMQFGITTAPPTCHKKE